MEEIKILIVTERFAPNFSIGAIRPTKIAKYLSTYFETSVFTVNRNGFEADVHLSKGLEALKIIYPIESKFGYYNGLFNNDSFTKGKSLYQVFFAFLKKQILKYQKSKIIITITYFKQVWNQHVFYFKGKSVVDKLGRDHFDLMISTYSTYRVAFFKEEESFYKSNILYFYYFFCPIYFNHLL